MATAYTAKGSATSAEAAEFIKWKAGALERAVLELIEEAGPDGLADFEIDKKLVGNMNGTARPRRCSLRDKGLIRDTGSSVVNPSSGRKQTRWAAARFFPAQICDDNETRSSELRHEVREPSPESPPPIDAARCHDDDLTGPSPAYSVLQMIEKWAEVQRLMWDGSDPKADSLLIVAAELETYSQRLRKIADEAAEEEAVAETGMTSFIRHQILAGAAASKGKRSGLHQGTRRGHRSVYQAEKDDDQGKIESEKGRTQS